MIVLVLVFLLPERVDDPTPPEALVDDELDDGLDDGADRQHAAAPAPVSWRLISCRAAGAPVQRADQQHPQLGPGLVEQRLLLLGTGAQHGLGGADHRGHDQVREHPQVLLRPVSRDR